MNYIDNEQATVIEALKRGATQRLLEHWLVLKRQGGRPGSEPDPIELRQMLEPEITAYQRMVAQEFNAMSPIPKGAFATLENYGQMRPLYYAAGFDDPCKDIFSQITGFTFLEGRIAGGIHSAYIPLLNQVTSILSPIPGLYQRISKLIKARSGFCPRFVAGTTSLSNHAFGLAIDMDTVATYHADPHIRDDVIPLLNKLVKLKAGFDYDFGSRFTDTVNYDKVLNTKQRIMVNYYAAKRASEIIKEFLKENLSTLETCRGEIARGAQKNASKADKTNAAQAKMAVDNEWDLQLLQQLSQKVPVSELREWREHGILNMPLELVAAFYVGAQGNPNFQWGGNYIKSKDFMHFELKALGQGGHGAATLTPDVNETRTLEKLFGPMFQPVMRTIQRQRAFDGWC